MSAGLSVCRAFAARLPSTHAILCRFDCDGGLSVRLNPKYRLWQEGGQVGCRISKVCGYGSAQIDLFCDRRLMITWSAPLVRLFETQYGEITTLIPVSVFDPHCCPGKTAAGAIAAPAGPSPVLDAQLCLPPAWGTWPGLTRGSE